MKYDYVYAYRRRTLPPESNAWFTRFRPGCWPTPDMLQVARELGCFLIPDGHCYSEHSCIEWRVSLSVIERHLYSASMNTDVASTRLKLASMLYCKGGLHLAEVVQGDVKNRYDNTVQAICGCGRMAPTEATPREAYAEAVNEENTDVMSANRVAYCVRFLPQEAY